MPNAFDKLENLTVVFHNQNYVNEVYETYNSAHAHLFLEWVKSFAIIRKLQRITLMPNVIQSDDEDFLSALQLFKLQHTMPKRKKDVMKNRELKIWDVITTQFANVLFTKSDVQKHLTLANKAAVHSVLNQLLEENKIKLHQPIKRKWYARSKPSHKVKQYQVI